MCACGTVLTPESLLHTVPQQTITAPTPGEKPQRIHKFIMEPNLQKTIQRAPQTCMIRAKNKDCCQTSPDGGPTQEPGSPKTAKKTKGEGFPVCVVGAQEREVLTLSLKQHVFHFHDRTVKTHDEEAQKRKNRNQAWLFLRVKKLYVDLRVGDLVQPCDRQCCSMPNSTRTEKVVFRSGGVAFCRPLSKFRRQEDQEKQSQKD
ncbi:hypothetical protein E5288_WYG021247 [Bos mutus]|uniref:Uncharacterized protein n=1 Tax=Bos mutus TaxID=72004 RepID=A0A6B0SAU9_9CETA|nr:hypothetical protein [Bos mutus]